MKEETETKIKPWMGLAVLILMALLAAILYIYGLLLFFDPLLGLEFRFFGTLLWVCGATMLFTLQKLGRGS